MDKYIVYGRKLGSEEWHIMEFGLTEAQARELMRDMREEGHYPPFGIRAENEQMED